MNAFIERKINDLLMQMSLKEKIGQLNQMRSPVSAEDVIVLKEKIRNGEVGSLVFATSATAGNDEQSHVNIELYNELQRIAVEESRLHIPMIYGRDVIHGHRTVYPIPLASAASFDTEQTEKCYRDIAEEAAADGIHWTFSPMIDVCHDPRWGRIIEGPGEDPYLGGCMAKAFVKGFQGEDLSDKKSVAACAKHFVGYGYSEGGRDYHRTEISDYTLYNNVLPPFRAAVDAGVMTMMSSFNDINGVPTTGSKKYMTDILRGQLGFEGFVVSDWGAVGQLQRQGVASDRAECAKIALNAGLDMDMVEGCFIENLEELVNAGEVSMDDVDLAVRRVLRVKFALDLFERPYREKFEYDKAAHLKHAREYAADSMVLLKNDSVLPLDKKTKISLVGPYAHNRRTLLGSWTLDGRAEETPNFSECLKEVLGDEIFVSDSSFYDDVVADGIKDSDVVILALGESWATTGEHHAVADILLEAPQRELVKKVKANGKKTIGVIFCGRPRSLQTVAEDLDGVLYAWHSGTETAHAVCDILFGEVVPSGKTPVTFPRQSGHIPLYYNVTASGRPVDCYYGVNAGNCYDDSVPTPLYPFGFGLSYTTFEYTKPSCDKETISLQDLQSGSSFTVSATIKNTGNYDGKETVQLYIRDLKSSIMRPIRELKDFKKILIASGESEVVTFSLGYDKLGYYMENGEFVVEAGEFEVFIGENCLTENKVTIQVIR